MNIYVNYFVFIYVNLISSEKTYHPANVVCALSAKSAFMVVSQFAPQ